MLRTAGGILGKDESKGNPDGVQVYFSNPDFVFANEFASPRFGQGALTVALQALLEKVLSFLYMLLDSLVTDLTSIRVQRISACLLL